MRIELFSREYWRIMPKLLRLWLPFVKQFNLNLNEYDLKNLNENCWLCFDYCIEKGRYEYNGMYGRLYYDYALYFIPEVKP
jgi:hypothetical protein